jgi:hypothetical protein
MDHYISNPRDCVSTSRSTGRLCWSCDEAMEVDCLDEEGSTELAST